MFESPPHPAGRGVLRPELAPKPASAWAGLRLGPAYMTCLGCLLVPESGAHLLQIPTAFFDVLIG